MSFLSGFNVSLNEVRLMAEGSIAAFVGGDIPAGCNVITAQQLGLAAQYQDGNYFTDAGSGASAIVLQQGATYIIAFRGTDGDDDTSHFLELFSGTYINHYQPLLSAIADSDVGGPPAIAVPLTESTWKRARNTIGGANAFSVSSVATRTDPLVR